MDQGNASGANAHNVEKIATAHRAATNTTTALLAATTVKDDVAAETSIDAVTTRHAAAGTKGAQTPPIRQTAGPSSSPNL